MNEYLDAAQILLRLLREEKHLDEMLSGGTSPLGKQLCYGALRHYYFYDCAIEELLARPLPDKHLDLRLLLLTGLYSLDHINRPIHASVNRVVEAATGLGKTWAKGFINALLRGYCRDAETIGRAITGKSPEAQKNHPLWLIEAITADWPDHAEIFDSNNHHAPMTLRVNLKRQSRDEYLKLLANEGIKARRGAFCGSAVVLDEAMPVARLPGFGCGRVSVQDEASQFAPGLMNLAPGMRVLDACAAPGGKACHILESEDVQLTALDRDRKRIRRLHDNLDRLSLHARVIVGELDAFTADSGFDRILLDLPCSATGIIRRRPDIKLLRRQGDIDKLSSIQRMLLNKAFDLLETGGELLYSTCSILRRENDRVIADFLAGADKAAPIKLEPPDNATATTLVGTAHGLQFLPTPSAHDGFYYAALRKVAP